MSKSHIILATAVLIGASGPALAGDLPITDEARYSPLQFILHTLPGRNVTVGASTAAGLAQPLQTERAYRTPAATDLLWMRRPAETDNGAR
ncbi:MAG: hypothetical protein ACRCTI_07075 [Beijerinckiaceae bacterium]